MFYPACRRDKIKRFRSQIFFLNVLLVSFFNQFGNRISRMTFSGTSCTKRHQISQLTCRQLAVSLILILGQPSCLKAESFFQCYLFYLWQPLSPPRRKKGFEKISSLKIASANLAWCEIIRHTRLKLALRERHHGSCQWERSLNRRIHKAVQSMEFKQRDSRQFSVNGI